MGRAFIGWENFLMMLGETAIALQFEQSVGHTYRLHYPAPEKANNKQKLEGTFGREGLENNKNWDTNSWQRVWVKRNTFRMKIIQVSSNGSRKGSWEVHENHNTSTPIPPGDK